MGLLEFLDSKPLYYKEIDHKRVHTAYAMISPYLDRATTIHIVGTNGKGSTGRMIAHLASKSGLSVGHYSSPHILHFSERIWIDGSDIDEQMLESAHQSLYGLLGEQMSTELSYFEYSTLLALMAFWQQQCDLIVLEAGLGGEFDATNVCDKELSVITPIGIDHQAFLGEAIEQIASTKLRSVQSKVLLAPQPYAEVEEIAKEIIHQKGASLHKLLNIEYIKPKWPKYLRSNARVAMSALEILGLPYDASDLLTIKLFGRFEPISPNIHIDVGHNPLAAKAIVEAMNPDTVLIYNSLDDKDYLEVLRILKPKLKRVEIIEIDSQRSSTSQEISDALNLLNIPYDNFDGTLDSDEHYLVFGSFYTVEKFLKQRQHVSI